MHLPAIRHTFAGLGAGLVALFLAGCATYQDDTAALRSAWQTGKLELANTEAQKGAKSNDNPTNGLVWQLEAGTTARAVQALTQSEANFARADELFTYWAEKPDTLVGYGISATLVNQAQLPYRGTAYDGIMLSTYRALNALQQNDSEKARVMLNRALERQRAAVELYAAAIKELDAQKNQKDQAFIGQIEKDPSFSAEVKAIEQPLQNMSGYAPFVNPFSVWLDGIFFLYKSTGPSDTERAIKSLERVAAMVAPQLVAADIALAKTGEQANTPITYVIFETGIAPWRIQRRIDLPTVFISKEVPYVGVALPELSFNNSVAQPLFVRGTGLSVATATVCDMDKVIAQEFKRALPAIIAKTILSAAAKASAQYGVRAATNNSGNLGALLQIAGVIYQVAVNNADLRTWSTLPKAFQIARIATPADRSLTVQAGTQQAQISLLSGKVNVVYVKSIAPLLPLIVSQFVLVY